MSDFSQGSLNPAVRKRAVLQALLRQNRSAECEAQGIPRRSGSGPVPFSFTRQRLWFLDRLDPGIPAYNVPMAFRLTGALAPEALERSLQAIVCRHQALRTVLRECNGQPVQLIVPEQVLPLALVDLRGERGPDREEQVRRLAIEAVRQPFDLAAGPLFRALLIQLAAAEHVLVLSLHHVVSDGWSAAVLVRELEALYQAFSHGRTAPLAALPILLPGRLESPIAHRSGLRVGCVSPVTATQSRIDGGPSAALGARQCCPPAGSRYRRWRARGYMGGDTPRFP